MKIIIIDMIRSFELSDVKISFESLKFSIRLFTDNWFADFYAFMRNIEDGESGFITLGQKRRR